MMQSKIKSVMAREILDSRGNPTVEAEVVLCDGTMERGIAPSGASTGAYEALELRDGETTRYQGKGVRNAVKNVNTVIANTIIGMDVMQVHEIDRAMIYADGTEDKSKLGANAILAVSMACTKAAATSYHIPLYRYIGGMAARKMPIPMMNIINGGVHAGNNIDFQEFMIMPVGACCFKEALRMGAEVYHSLQGLLKKHGKNTTVGDEGGFAPDLSEAAEVLDYLTEAVKLAGYEPGKEIAFAMDAAASELYDKDKEMYFFSGEAKEKGKKEAIARNADEMIALYQNLQKGYPLISVEDPLDEQSWDYWQKLTRCLGEDMLLVGDDLFVTNTARLRKGLKEQCGNSILIKPNQIGTITETLATIRMAQGFAYKAIASHRSGETEDTFIADLAVGMNTGFIKTGAPCRSERVAKYNQLLRIEEMLGKSAIYGLDTL